MNYLTVVREEVEELNSIKGWILLYGRRKVGKTFLLKNFHKWDAYITVRRDLSLRTENVKIRRIEDIVDSIGELLEENYIVVIDEFQRLPEHILEDLTKFHPKGKLVLSGSSLGVVRKFFEPKSPLLGFFTPYKLSLIKPIDIFSTLIKYYDPVKSLELASYMRDPWLIPLYSGEDTVSFIYKYSCRYWQVVKALIGEVFAEEERTLTKTYEAVLSLLGSRVWRIKDITGILYAKGVIKEPSSSHVSGFVKNLVEMDLVESIKLFKTRRKYYRLKSPIMETFYYLENRFDVSEREVSLDEVRPELEKIIRLEVEDFIADFFAHYFSGRREYSLDPEIDFIITVRKRILAIGEVKWGRYTRQDLKKFYEKVETLPGMKIFITKEKDQDYYEDVRVYDARDLADMMFKRGFIR